MSNVYILGGAQSDFSQNWMKSNTSFSAQLETTVRQGFSDMQLPLSSVDSVVVGNFAGELFIDQGLMSGLIVQAIPEFYGLPSMRTEAACASGSMALLNGMAQIQAGWADVVCVIGAEQMRNVPALDAAQYLGTAIHQGQECTDVSFPWPHLFGKLGELYDERYGLDQAHLTALAKLAFHNASLNPLAQTRNWIMPETKFVRDDAINPTIDGMIRRSDCAQVTDGAAMIILASDKAMGDHMQANPTASYSKIAGFGHTTAPINFESKREYMGDYVFPHIRKAVTQAYKKANVESVEDIDLWETHDCFSTTFYMAIDHLGLTKPGQNFQAIEENWLGIEGKTPINPTGGLIGIGHPVGATGVRQMLDCHKQVNGLADANQVANARRASMLNLGGSATTAACFVIESNG